MRMRREEQPLGRGQEVRMEEVEEERMKGAGRQRR